MHGARIATPTRCRGIVASERSGAIDGSRITPHLRASDRWKTRNRASEVWARANLN